MIPTKTQAHQLMYVLKATSIAFPLATTSLGVLAVNIRKDEEEWFLTLDAIPLSKDTEKDIFTLFSIEK